MTNPPGLANLLLTAVAEPVPENAFAPLRQACFALSNGEVQADCSLAIPPTAICLCINNAYYIVDLRALLEQAIDLHTDGEDVPPSIPPDAWHDAYGGNLSLGIFRPDFVNVIDVRGDVTKSTDGHCRWGIKVKCTTGHEVNLRGPGANVAAGKAAVETAYATALGWAAQLQRPSAVGGDR